jgi:hypothetical protein
MTTNTNGTAGDPGAAGDLGKYIPGQDGSKFKTVEELARAKAESDRFIEDLKREQAELRASLKELEGNLQKARGVDDVLAALKGMSAGNDTDSFGGRVDTGTFRSSGPASGNQSAGTNGTDGNAEARVKELVQQLLTAREVEAKAAANWSEVQSKFLSKHHNDPDEAQLGMRATARELGMDFNTFEAIAKQNPNLVLRAAGLAQSASGAKAPLRFSGTSTNVDASTSSATGPVKNQAYFKKLREQLKAQGKLADYYKPHIQQELHKSSKELGDAFFTDAG